MSDLVSIAAAELEECIKLSGARDGIDHDEKGMEIFDSQRDDYRAWMAAVIAVIRPHIVSEEREACAKIADLYVEKAWSAQDIAADIRSRGETKE